MRKAVLTFLRKENEVLLILNNYPSGAVWNGVSGYIDEGETPEQAAVREVEEEIGVVCNPEMLLRLGEFSIFTVYEIYEWEGEPHPSEEGILETKWCAIKDLPYDKMHKGNDIEIPKFLKEKSFE